MQHEIVAADFDGLGRELLRRLLAPLLRVPGEVALEHVLPAAPHWRSDVRAILEIALVGVDRGDLHQRPRANGGLRRHGAFGVGVAPLFLDEEQPTEDVFDAFHLHRLGVRLEQQRSLLLH